MRLKLFLTIVLTMVIGVGSVFAMPECWVDVDPMDGTNTECWEVYVQADWRYYHDTAPGSDQLHNPGGYKLGFTIWNSTDISNKVEFRNIENGNSYVVAPFPAYQFFGSDIVEHLIWLGHTINAQGSWDVYVNDELRKTGVQAVIGTPKLPVVSLHKMKKGNDGIQIKFSAPLVENFTRINLRIFNLEATDFIHQIKYFDISKSINDTIPLEYSGHQARFEYRTNYGARTLLYITLP